MIQRWLDRLKSVVVTLRFSILSIFISLFLLTTLLIITVTSIRFSNTLTFTALELMKHASTTVERELEGGLKPAEIETLFSMHLMRMHLIEANQTDLVPYTFYIVRSLPLVEKAFWGDVNGIYIYSQKEKDNTVTTEIFDRVHQPPARITNYRNNKGYINKVVSAPNFDYDPRRQFWYPLAQAAQNDFPPRVLWTNIYLSTLKPHLGITAVTPVVESDTHRFMGVFGLTISLEFLSNFLTTQNISPHGYAFIITKNGDLVAFPKKAPFPTTPLASNQIYNLQSLHLPLINKSLAYYKKTSQQEFIISDHGDDYIVTYKPVAQMSNDGWLIGAIVPKNDFIGELQRLNLITLEISMVILILGIMLVSNLVTRIVKPIKLIVRETQRIRRFELDHDMQIHSRIKEVISLNEAVKAMKLGLKSFQKYVPRALVQQLIESGQDIRAGGERKQMVVFFSDIQNFTTIAEDRDPQQLMRQLCDYFEYLSQIIQWEKGTIDKYIGDSMMAFWGAPLPVTKPHEHAAHAALHCQSIIAELNAAWQKIGYPAFNTRIGIHAGEALVGNLGSSERLNYTALGDTINVASRLEGMNKIYKTKILVSEMVYEKIKDTFVLRLVDCLPLPGRTHPICIYELICEDINDIKFDIAAYRTEFEKGFAAYQQGDAVTALTHFRHCMNIYPEDTVAPIFIERCS